MIRLKISNFIRKYKYKLKDLGSKLIIVAIWVFMATIILSSFSGVENNTQEEDKLNVYKPTETIIKGSDISKEQYEKDTNLVNKFLEFCNNEKIEDAYNLVDEECKKELYPTIEDFKKYYYDYVFDKEREYNLQSWISTSKYTVYKIRYTNNMMATGTYNGDDVYQDYITLIKNSNEEKISIGSFIGAEGYNTVTKTDEIEATVLKKKVYLDVEEYVINIKNNTDKTILLDTLETGETINLIGSGVEFGAITNGLFSTNLKISPGISKDITIKFMKNLSSNKSSDKIEFSNVIKDYDTYMKNKDEYTNIINIIIKVED